MNEIINELVSGFIKDRHKFGREETEKYLRDAMIVCWVEGEMQGSEKAFNKVKSLLEK